MKTCNRCLTRDDILFGQNIGKKRERRDTSCNSQVADQFLT